MSKIEVMLFPIHSDSGRTYIKDATIRLCKENGENDNDDYYGDDFMAFWDSENNKLKNYYSHSIQVESEDEELKTFNGSYKVICDEDGYTLVKYDTKTKKYSPVDEDLYDISFHKCSTDIDDELEELLTKY